jgi:hypothetical protein
MNPNEVTSWDNAKHSPLFPHSVGIGQWNDRVPLLVNFARSQGVEGLDDFESKYRSGWYRNPAAARDLISRIPIEVQADFVPYELRTTEGRSAAMLNNAQNLLTATAGGISYNRPAGWISAALSIWPKTADLIFQSQFRPTHATACCARAE